MKLKSLFAGTALLLALSTDWLFLICGKRTGISRKRASLKAQPEEFQAAAEKDKDAAEAFRGLGIAKWELEDYEAPAMRSSLRWTTAPTRREHFIILSAAATIASAIRLRL